MKIKINKHVVRKLNSFSVRHDNYRRHYNDFNGDLVEFLDRGRISHSTKVWTALRVMPKFLVEVFTIDCAISAQRRGSVYAIPFSKRAEEVIVDIDYVRSAMLSSIYDTADHLYSKKSKLNQIAILKYLISSERSKC